MARKQKDLFGFDELKKAFTRCEKKYPDSADNLLMTMGDAVKKQTKQNTPVHEKEYYPGKNRKKGKLKRSWSLRKVKVYGNSRVVRIQTQDPVGHLIERGHYIKPRGRGRKNREDKRNYRYEKGSTGSKGFVEGSYPLSQAIEASRKRFGTNAQKLLEDITSDLKL